MTEDRQQKSDEESDPFSFDICHLTSEICYLKQALICGNYVADRLLLTYYLDAKL